MKRKTLAVALSIILCLSILVGCESQNASGSNATNQPQPTKSGSITETPLAGTSEPAIGNGVFEDKEFFHFKFSYNENWIAPEENNEPTEDMIMLSFVVGNPPTETVIVGGGPASLANVTSDEEAKQSIIETVKDGEDVKDIEIGEAEMFGKTATRITYSAMLGSVRMGFIRYFVLYNENIYDIAVWCQNPDISASKVAAYDEFAKSFAALD